jgi:hypothetical protein
MFFSMNHRKRAPMGIIQVAQVVDNTRSTPLQVASVPVVKAVDSCIAKVIKKDESYEVREIKEKSEKKRIIYTIGDEQEKHEEKHEKEMKEHKKHENIPIPVVEEPVIETLSAVVFPVCSLPPIIEEESESKEEVDSVLQDSIEHVQQIQEIKKKKRRAKGVRK